jgi:hypothetical protein
MMMGSAYDALQGVEKNNDAHALTRRRSDPNVLGRLMVASTMCSRFTTLAALMKFSVTRIAKYDLRAIGHDCRIARSFFSQPSNRANDLIVSAYGKRPSSSRGSA